MIFLPKCVNMEETLIDTCSICEDLTSKNNFQMTVEMQRLLLSSRKETRQVVATGGLVPCTSALLSVVGKVHATGQEGHYRISVWIQKLQKKTQTGFVHTSATEED